MPGLSAATREDQEGRVRAPILAIVGMGRAGKDTAAEWLRDHTPLRYLGGSSWYGRHYMAERLSADCGYLLDPDVVWATRHSDRDKWFRYLQEFRENDPARLVRMARESSDIVVGVRDRAELLAAREEGLVDLIVWVDNPRAPVDKTVTFSPSDCDVVVLNEDSLAVYLARWHRLARTIGIID